MKLGLALAWTLVLIVNIVGAILGATPTWVAVFSPLIALVLDCWNNYINEQLNGEE